MHRNIHINRENGLIQTARFPLTNDCINLPLVDAIIFCSIEQEKAFNICVCVNIQTYIHVYRIVRLLLLLTVYGLLTH